MRSNFDVAVLGGGPGGSTVAGLLAQQGIGVVLVERTDYSRRRAGESLPPAFIPLLARLGLNRTVTEECYIRCPGILSVWGSTTPVERDFIRMPYGLGL